MLISALARRVLARLERAEAHEVDPWFRDDYRIAWITVLNAARGAAVPNVAATYAVLGLHPGKVWAAIVARRKAQLGPLYETFFQKEGLRAPAQPSRIQGPAHLPPRKPVQSVRDARDRAA